MNRAVEARKSDCIGCGGPCNEDCVDNFGNAYKGCSSGCRLLSQAEIDVLTKSLRRRARRRAQDMKGKGATT